MAAHALPSILPPLSESEALTTSRVHSLAGILPEETPLVTAPPFRAPHHTSSREGVIGGGRRAGPGEVSLAHNGILFLDEAPEFRKHVLQSLREPVEEHSVRIVRADGAYRYPADFQLLLAANPCPCGLSGVPGRVCLCSGSAIEAYWQRLGGPLLDRIDIRISVTSESTGRRSGVEETSSACRERVRRARIRQRERFGAEQTSCNGRVSSALLEQHARLSVELDELLARASRHTALSTRAQLSARRVARTIADLAGSSVILPEHLLEAIQHRRNGEESLALLATL